MTWGADSRSGLGWLEASGIVEACLGWDDLQVSSSEDATDAGPANEFAASIARHLPGDIDPESCGATHRLTRHDGQWLAITMYLNAEYFPDGAGNDVTVAVVNYCMLVAEGGEFWGVHLDSDGDILHIAERIVDWAQDAD